MMQEHIHLSKFNPSPLFETIERHFPIGVMRRTEHDQMTYRSFPGLKLYTKAIQNAIHETASFESIWLPVENELMSITGLPVVGTTYGQAPCFSSYLKVRKEQVGSFTRHFEIHVFVSVIGPYFTVLGKDWSEIALADNLIRPTNFYLVSPFDQDLGLFTIVANLLKAHFPGYRFVPHCLYSLEVSNFEVPYSDEEENLIFNGIFNQEFRTPSLIVGDSYYSSEEWIRDDFEPPKGTWEIYPPMGG